mmetsp:Transcript_30218/g.88409  ORF Transcript_30218/g.88409 Transcript_30218/m.88409 type:complete len:115 (+) Transcript_30218:1217-1561(+)
MLDPAQRGAVVAFPPTEALKRAALRNIPRMAEMMLWPAVGNSRHCGLHGHQHTVVGTKAMASTIREWPGARAMAWPQIVFARLGLCGLDARVCVLKSSHTATPASSTEKACRRE